MKPGGYDTVGPDELLWDRWVRNASDRPDAEAIVHWRAAEQVVRWTWRDLLRTARGAAAYLKEQGIRPGDVCALIMRHHPSFHPLYLGVSAIGAVPSVLAYPNTRLHPEKFAHGLAGMARRSGLDFILTERSLEAAVRPLVSGERSSVRGLLFPLDAHWDPTDTGDGIQPQAVPSDPCLLQHSSGTTGLQKAVILSHRAVLGHVERYGEAIRLDRARDKIVSWLPLYHDMGMVAAYHMALAAGVTTIQIDPFEWVVEPELLLKAASQEKATLTWLPNFAYNFLADRVHEDELNDVRLDSIRLYINCSEPVRAESHRKFIERLGRHGARAEALAACYAMAETTFAATQTEPGSPPETLVVDREALSQGRVLPGRQARIQRTCVSSGRPISGCKLRVVSDAGEDLPAGNVGEIAIKSVSMFDGYRNNVEDTERVLRDGWYYTGDLGFEWEDEYYVIGRKKDVIIVAGNNIYPEDIEGAVSGVSGVLPGRVIAFGQDDPEAGTECVCIIAETEATDDRDRKRVVHDIVRAGMTIDITIADVYLAPPRWLIKSSAGKPSRRANRERVLAGELRRA